MSRFETINYNRFEFDFAKLLSQLFNHGDLYTLHAITKEKYPIPFEVTKDSHTELHQTFYDKYRNGWPEFDTLYERFIKEVIAPLYETDFLYQRKVTIRFHLPENVAVGAFHNDAEYQHPVGEQNYIVPLTFANNTASVFIESTPGAKDFQPVFMRPGEIIKFNGNQLTHGNKINKTTFARVSFDFRVLPIEFYKPEASGESITRKNKFVLGEYYSLFKK